MQHSEKLERIRGNVARIFRAYGLSQGEPPMETILIRDGFYCGHRFACEGLRAVWFLEEDLIKVFGGDGEFLQATRVSEMIQEAQRRAA